MKIFRILKDKSPTILCCVAAAGVISSIIFAVKGTPKAMKKLEKARGEKSKELSKMEVVKTVAPCYIPAASMALGTIACIFSANILNKRKQAMLTSAYAALNTQYLGYSSEVKRLFGNEAHEEIISNIPVQYPEKNDIYSADVSRKACPMFDGVDGNEEILCYDPTRPIELRWYTSTPIKVLNAIISINNMYAVSGEVTKNEYYDILGLESIKYGDDEGWDISSGIYYIGFETIHNTADDNTLEYWIINPTFWPEPFEKYS